MLCIALKPIPLGEVILPVGTIVPVNNVNSNEFAESVTSDVLKPLTIVEVLKMLDSIVYPPAYSGYVADDVRYTLRKLEQAFGKVWEA